MNVSTIQSQMNRIQAQLENQMQENAQIKRDIAMLEINTNVNIESLKGDVQMVLDITAQFDAAKDNINPFDIQKMQLKIITLEENIKTMMAGKYLGVVTERVLQSPVLQSTISQQMKDKAISVCDSRLNQFQILLNQKLTSVGNEIVNLTQSNRILDSYITSLLEKQKVFEGQMGFLDQYKRETSSNLNKLFSEFQTRFDSASLQFREEIHQLQYNLLSLQNLDLENKLRDFQDFSENIQKELNNHSFEVDAKLLHLEQCLRIEIESKLKQAPHIPSPKKTNRIVNFANLPLKKNQTNTEQMDRHLQNDQQTFQYSYQRPGNGAKLSESRLNFSVNAEQVERFLVDESKNFHNFKPAEIEKAYFYEDCFEQMIQRVNEMKQIFLRCQQDMKEQIQYQSQQLEQSVQLQKSPSPQLKSYLGKDGVFKIKRGSRKGSNEKYLPTTTRQSSSRPQSQANSRINLELADLVNSPYLKQKRGYN